MNFETAEQREELEALATSSLTSGELFEKVKGDIKALTFLAKTQVQFFEFDRAIELIKLGASAGIAIQWLQLFAPQYIVKAREAEQVFFRNRYLADPQAWEKERERQITLMEGFLDTAGKRFYSDAIIHATLTEEGYGLELRNCGEQSRKDTSC